VVKLPIQRKEKKLLWMTDIYRVEGNGDFVAQLSFSTPIGYFFPNNPQKFLYKKNIMF
jgi:hypothetical protein